MPYEYWPELATFLHINHVFRNKPLLDNTVCTEKYA